MNGDLNIFLKQKEAHIKVPPGTTALEVFKAQEIKLDAPVMNVKINNKTFPINQRLFHDADLEYVDYSNESGFRVYLRTLTLIMAKAASKIRLESRSSKMDFEYAVSSGYYCVWGTSEVEPTKEEVKMLEEEMWRIIKADLPINVLDMPTQEAIDFMNEKNKAHTAELLKTLGQCYTKCVELDGFVDYIFGSVLPRTGNIWDFAIEPFQQGILLRLPRKDKPKVLEEKVEQPQLFDAFKKNIVLLKALGVEDVGPMNEKLRDRVSAGELIRVAEAMQEKQIASIAEEIARRHEEDGVRIVLLAGPSSSGKTTTSKRLLTQLITNLLQPYTLSLDDYFLPRDLSPRDENGNYDFESLYALDLPYLNEELNKMIAGEEVDLPTYDFASGTRVFRNRKLKLDKDSVLIIEGIHALNPELTAHIPKNKLYKIYVSALTTISLDNHNFISTSDNRLIRRIIRDSKYRNHSAIRTISMWPSVRRGEEKWIFPYQEEADVMFNSAMLYELSALRPIAEPILREVKEIEPEYAEAQRLLGLLAHFEPIGLRYLPPTSLLREFIGGSSFIY